MDQTILLYKQRKEEKNKGIFKTKGKSGAGGCIG